MYLWLVRVCVSKIPAGHHPSPLEVNRRSWRPKPSGWPCKHSSRRPLKWEARTSAPPHKAETHRRKHVVRQYIHTSIYTCFTQEDILNLILLKVLNNTFFSCWNQQYSLHILEPIFHNHALTLLYYSTTYWVPWKWTFMTLLFFWSTATQITKDNQRPKSALPYFVSSVGCPCDPDGASLACVHIAFARLHIKALLLQGCHIIPVKLTTLVKTEKCLFKPW